ncbi:hypothetical protein Mapa_015538 [Marchantia paleacea]|nr:hypothetical protein Mapa_015538 [Marchantia paleacea]
MERTHGSTVELFVTALLVLSSVCSVAEARKPRPLKFTYYLHDDFVPPDTTAAQVASANGTFTNTFVFGDISVFDSLIRIGAESTSAEIGHSSGQIVGLIQPTMRFITFVVDLSFPEYSGTLSCSARFNISAPSWEVGVSAGTGSFRGATGYLTATMVDPNPAAYIIQYNAILYLPH